MHAIPSTPPRVAPTAIPAMAPVERLWWPWPGTVLFVSVFCSVDTAAVVDVELVVLLEVLGMGSSVMMK